MIEVEGENEKINDGVSAGLIDGVETTDYGEGYSSMSDEGGIKDILTKDKHELRPISSSKK